jgi:hypothetical protein
MKYMLLINQGSTPTPPSEEWENLPEEEREAMAAAYKAHGATPGVTPGLQLQPPAPFAHSLQSPSPPRQPPHTRAPQQP